MSNIYDNWERLVKAVLQRERDREIALAHSRTPSSSSMSSSFISDPATPSRDDQNIQLRTSSNKIKEINLERLLLSDYEDIMSLDPEAYAAMKDLYLSLCERPILLDSGKMSFHIDKKTGKKCAMIGARKLTILRGEIPEFWKFTSHKYSRFPMVAELKQVLKFDIRGKIDTNILSPKTHYAAYLVFRFAKIYEGSLVSAYGSVSYDNTDHYSDVENQATLHFEPGWTKNGNVAVSRPDRWMEVEIGNLCTDQQNRLLEAHLWKYDKHLKSGLIIEGIEFRPTNAEVLNFLKEGESLDPPEF